MSNGTDHISIPKAFPQPKPAAPADPLTPYYAPDGQGGWRQLKQSELETVPFFVEVIGNEVVFYNFEGTPGYGGKAQPLSTAEQKYYTDLFFPEPPEDGGGAVGIGPPEGWIAKTIGTQTYYYDPVSRSVVDQQGTPVRNITSEVLPGTGRLALRDADSGIIIETVADPNFISDYDKQQLLQQKAQMWWDAARTLIELKGYNYQQAMDWYNTQWDAQERLIDRAVTDHNAKIEAADISTRRAGTMLDILKASIPAGAQLNLPVPGQPGKTFAAPVHQASMKDFFPGPSVEDIAKVAWPDLPPIEMPAKPTPITPEDIQKELELAMSSIKPGLGF